MSLAELQLRKDIDLVIPYSEPKRHIQQVQCTDRWTRGCLNKGCAAFRNVSGSYYCVRKNMP